MKVSLSIGGSDSSAGAGVQQDLKVFSSLKVYGVSVITAITAQNTQGVKKVQILESEMVAEQIDALFSDIKIKAVKTGMLGNKEITKVVYEKMREYQVRNLVVDPVFLSTSGDRLLEEKALPYLKKLISLAKITTPNLKEAEVISGVKIKREEEIKKAAERINSEAVVITRGDKKGKDLLYYQGKIQRLDSKLNLNEQFHGTGCAFSSAITAFLANDFNLLDAVKKAKHFMNCSLARNFSIDKSKKGLRIPDTSNLMMHKDFKDKKKREVVKEVAQAIELFCSEKNSWKLIPEVGVNIAMALPKAKNLGEVAGLTGRIIRDRNQAVPVGIVNFFGSSHVGRVVLTAMKFNQKIRAGMNIRYDKEIIKICQKLNLKIATFERAKEPPATKTMEFGTKEAIESFGQVPQIIYDEGGKGKEAMIRILGKEAKGVVKIAKEIAKKF